MNKPNSHVKLDDTLPPELRKVVSYEAASQPGGQVAAVATDGTVTEPNAEDETMDKTQEQAIRDAAKAEATALLEGQEAVQSVARRIEDLVTAKTVAEEQTATAQAAVDTATATLAQKDEELTTANATITERDAAIATKDEEIVTLTSAAVVTAADLTEKTQNLANIEAEQVLAGRKTQLDEAGLATEEFIDRATVRNEDGAFAMSNEQFDSWIADLKAVKASVKPAEETTPPAGVVPETPVNADATTPAPETPATSETPASASTPVAPDMTVAGCHQKAVAALMGGQVPTPSADGAVNEYTAIGVAD